MQTDNNDPTRITTAFTEMTDDDWRAVIAKSLSLLRRDHPYLQRDELESEAGLVSAAFAVAQSNGTIESPEAYLDRMTRNAAHAITRRCIRARRARDVEITHAHLQYARHADTVESHGTDHYSEIDMRIDLEAAIVQADADAPKTLARITAIATGGATMTEMAEDEGVNKSTISRRHQRDLRRVRCVLDPAAYAARNGRGWRDS